MLSFAHKGVLWSY